MRCQSCDYELWHCTKRVCPECGDAFSLTEYAFECGKVLFHCPHCDHGIEGKNPSGRPPENIEQCASCGLAVGLDLFIVRPVAGLQADELSPQLPIYTANGSWFSRYFATVWLILSQPQQAISRVPIHEPLQKAWKFFAITILITLAVGMIPFAFIILVGNIFGSSSLGAIKFAIITFGELLVVGVFSFFYIVMWSLLTHVLLHITGGSSFTLRRTMQAVLYGGGAVITGVVPCCGGLLSFVWWLVASTNMVAKGQRVHGGRASFATLFGPLLIFIFVCGSYLMLVFTITGQGVARAIVNSQQMQQQVQQQELKEEQSELIDEHQK